ncbi:MAG: twin-arginine translocation signal domain-containing protein, partial [Anaerolineales bacterium]|nr:twin-arginine translocation signal domain-containing protein [Anaerolineales bacterium]
MSKPCLRSQKEAALSRRDFLRLAGAGAAALLMQGCQKATPATTPTVVPPAGPISSRVAIGQATSYEQTAIREKVRQLIDDLGGLGDIVKAGDSVAIKTNLTGGVNSGKLAGLAPID